MTQAKHLKGEYNLNPTNMVMKQGSQKSREGQKPAPGRIDGTRMPEAHETKADTANLGSAMSSKKAFGEGHISDFYGVENQVHHSAHPAMQTRKSHPSEHKHTDGRKHEDHHAGVRMAKGK
jgi:hypothetical protein